MALINCKECNKEISSAAKACPNCGAPVIKKSSGARIAITVFVVLIVLYFLVSAPATNDNHTTNDNHISVPSDPKAEYTLIEKSMNGANPVLIAKRHTDISGTSYSKNEFDCSSSKYRPIADSEDLESIRNNQSSVDMVDLVPGSIKYWQWVYACKPA